MNPSYPESQKHSPFRPPDWRWRRAEHLVAAGRYYCRRRDDEATGRAVHYLRALTRGRGVLPAKVAKLYADIHAAHRLFERGGQARVVVEARILARQTPGEVAWLTALPVEVVRAYEALFFDCRPFLGARDWVFLHAIRGHEYADASVPDPGAVLKAFAFAGGPLVLEAVMPHLLLGQDSLGPPPDLSTPE